MDRGSARRVVPLLELLSRSGVSVSVLCPGEGREIVSCNGVAYHFWKPGKLELAFAEISWRIYDSFFYRVSRGRTTARQRRQWWHYLRAGLFPSLRRAVRNRTAEADVVLLEYAFWFKLLPRKRVPVILTLHDILSDMLPSGFLHRRVRNRELKAARAAEAVICVLREDQKSLRNKGVEAVVAPHAGYVSEQIDQGVSANENSLLAEIRLHRSLGGRVAFFVGSSLQPNVEAVQSLRRIAALCDDRWLIVAAGSCCHPGQKAKHFLPVGPVSSVELRQLYAQSDVFISPVSSGTGASTKILEAMSHAKPVVATSVSVRGYELVAGRDYLLCAGDGEFADVLRDLSEDPSLAANLSEAGRRFAAAHQPESAYAPYLQLVRELAARP